VVESLEKKGFIKATGTVQEGKRPQRTIYEITDEGSVEMTDWLTELLATPTKEYPAFMAGLSFVAALDPDDALDALRHRAEALAIKLNAHRATRQAVREAGLPRLFELEGEFEEGQIAAELAFVKKLSEEMADGTLEGLDMWRLFHTAGFDAEEVNFTFTLPEG